MVAKKKTTRKAAKPAAKPAAKKTVAKRKVAKKKVAAPKAAKPVAKVNGGWWGNSFTACGALIALAAVLGIMAFFAAWIGDHFGGYTVCYNGIDFLTASADEKEFILNNSWQTIVPLLSLILSIIVLLAIILPAFKIRTNRVATDVIVVVAGLIMFILCICFLFGQVGGEDVFADGKFLDCLCIGYYWSLIVSIVFVLFGLADGIRNAKA